jgi:photosystem II stability/assembly factor-like uncharacterized protein
MRDRIFFKLSLILLFLPWLISAQAINSELFQGLSARGIGPSGMSGRVTSFDVDLSNPDIIYVGSASGGLWKSENGGYKWAPIFDDQPVTSIGAISIYQRNPNIIWVGTGEGNPRNSHNSGNGVYMSNDGGVTWKHMGLENTRNIHRIFVDPFNPDVVIVGVQGSAWQDTPDRGVYKTTDGGKTWSKILYVNERVGIGEMVRDPTNPNKFIANMWEFRRWPWFFKSGGAGSGMYVTMDAGTTWKKITSEDGLPEGELGKMGLAIAPGSPQVVYAIVEAKKNGFYKSEDGGFTWKLVTTKNIGDRPFYYAEIYVDPSNENRIYNIFSGTTVSEDGGKTFKTFTNVGRLHGDNHAFWIHPNDPSFMLIGNDGGMGVTRDKGVTWYYPENLPLGQFYHISVDNDIPFNIYGGLQDNGSWAGPSSVYVRGRGDNSNLIYNSEWTRIGGGDGFDVIPDLENSRYGFAQSQKGNIQRYDKVTGDSEFRQPVHPEGTFLRFNWNAGVARDPHNVDGIYMGSQFLHYSADKGKTWEIISPDLTTNDPAKQKQLESGGITYDVTGAENHTTILAVSPSSLNKDIIWVGTDDGNVQLTRDKGKTWANVAMNIKGVPAGSWINQVHASSYNEGEAFVVINNYRRNDWTPWVFQTKDYGKTWKRLVNENTVRGFVHSFAQDPIEPRLMFVGTEFGLYMTVDGAANWVEWKNGYPTASTMDLVIHPRDHDLVIGTYGRSVYVLDDIRPMRALATQGKQLLDKPLALFDVPDAYAASTTRGAKGYSATGDGLFAGENRPYGALISFYVKETAGKKDSVKVEILQEEQVVRTLYADAKKGFNRTSWDLRYKEVREPDTSRPKPGTADSGGFTAVPGTYTVKVVHGEDVATTEVKVLGDPRVTPISLQERERKLAMIKRWEASVNQLTAAVDNLREALAAVERVDKLLADREDDASKALRSAGKDLKTKVKALREPIFGKEDMQGIYRDPTTVEAIINLAANHLGDTYMIATPTQETILSQAEEAVKTPIANIGKFVQSDWSTYKEKVRDAQIQLIE